MTLTEIRELIASKSGIVIDWNNIDETKQEEIRLNNFLIEGDIWIAIGEDENSKDWV